MKLTQITIVFLIFALLTSCVAATENKDLPTKEEITGFIAGIPVSDNYISTAFDAVKDKQPTWNCDIWVDQNDNQILSLYYVAPNSAKGYGSIYFNELGKEISMSGVEVELVESYVGKDISEENIPVETTSTSIQERPTEEENQPVEEVQSVGDERLTETENNDLPTKEEITDFIASIPVSDNYISTVFDAVKDKHSTWNCDIWVDQNDNQILSLYYVAPDSAKGYSSIYFNELGKEISMRGVEVELVESYVGEDVSDENTHASIQEKPAEEETQPVENNVRSIEDEQLAEYEERLAEYEERLNEYEEAQSIGDRLQTKNTIQSVDGEDQSEEYKELLGEYKELLDEYQEAQKGGSVNPPTEPEETKRGIEIRDGLFVTVVGGVIVCIIELLFLKRKRGRRSNL